MAADYIGERLRRFRRLRNLSIRQLARKAKVPQSTVSGVESGLRLGRHLTADTITKLCFALEITVDTFIGNPPDETDDNERHPAELDAVEA